MVDQSLLDLLEGNRTHVESLDDDYFAGVRDAQHPDVVSICCSDSRVPQERMWGLDDPGWLFAPSNIGNVAWEEHDGDRQVNGNLLYPVVNTGTRAVAVVGHTGCGAVTAAYQLVTEGDIDQPPAIERRVRSLRPVVEAALDGPVDGDAPDVVNRLVEYNVDRQVAFLRDAEEMPDDTAVYGFVYDFQDAYGEVPGRTVLVNLDGETDTDTIAGALPEEYRDAVGRLR